MPWSSDWHLPATGIFTWENALTNISSIWDIFQMISCLILFSPHSQHCTVEKQRHLTTTIRMGMSDIENQYFPLPFCVFFPSTTSLSLSLHLIKEKKPHFMGLLFTFLLYIFSNKVQTEERFIVFLDYCSYRLQSLLQGTFLLLTNYREQIVIALLPLNWASNKYDNLGVGGRNTFIEKFMAAVTSLIVK